MSRPLVRATAPRLLGTLLSLMATTSVVACTGAVVTSGSLGPQWWGVPLALAATLAYAAVVRAAVLGLPPDRAALALFAVTTATVLSAPLIGHLGGQPPPAPPPQEGARWPYYLAVATVSAAAVLTRRWPFPVAATALAATATALALVRSLPPVTDPHSVSTLRDAAFLTGLAVAVSSACRGVEDVSMRVRSARAAAQRADTEAEELALAEAERNRWEAAVHDDVLTALRAAGSAHTPVQVAHASEAARDALAALAAGPRTLTVSTHVLAQQLHTAVLGVLPEAQVGVSVEPGAVPGRVAEALTDATTELVRNAERHNGTQVRVRVRGHVTGTSARLHVSDDGQGFDATAVDARRLGLRVSVVGRLASVGGAAEVTSSPGRGTSVQLRWPR